MNGSYVVEVKPSVFSGTSLTRADFDSVSNMSITEFQSGDNVQMEFSSREDAEEWIRFRKGQDMRILQPGRLRIVASHPEDDSEVDGYLLFKPLA